MKSLLSSFIHWYPLENCTVFLWHGDDFIYCLLLRSTILIFFGLKVCSLDIYYTEKAKMNPPNNLGSLMETTMASALVIQLFDVGIFSFFLFIKEFHTVFCRLTGMMLSILQFCLCLFFDKISVMFNSSVLYLTSELAFKMQVSMLRPLSTRTLASPSGMSGVRTRYYYVQHQFLLYYISFLEYVRELHIILLKKD